MSVTCDKAFFFGGDAQTLADGQRGQKPPKEKGEEEHQISGKEQRSDDVTKTKLMMIMGLGRMIRKKMKNAHLPENQ